MSTTHRHVHVSSHLSNHQPTVPHDRSRIVSCKNKIRHFWLVSRSVTWRPDNNRLSKRSEAVLVCSRNRIELVASEGWVRLDSLAWWCNRVRMLGQGCISMTTRPHTSACLACTYAHACQQHGPYLPQWARQNISSPRTSGHLV